MNRRPPSFLPLSKAAVGFLQYKTTEGLSPNTLKRYQQFLRLWLEFAGDVPINRIKTDDVRRFLIWLRTDYQPKRMTGGDQPLASKTIHSTYMCLSAFYTWANREFELPNPIKAIPAPKFEMAQIDPYNKEEVEALLKVCEYCDEVQPSNRRKFIMRRATAKRDQAVILTCWIPGCALRNSRPCASAMLI